MHHQILLSLAFVKRVELKVGRNVRAHLFARSWQGKSQLRRFLDAARAWESESDARIIDLSGVDNLVLDRSYNVRYVDSFGVFFYPDLLYVISDFDTTLSERIDTSRNRINYLERILQQAEADAA